MNALKITPLFFTVMLTLDGCVNSHPVQTSPEPRDLRTLAIVEETRVNLALIASVEKVELAKIDEASKLLVGVLIKSKDPVLLTKLHNKIYDRINSDDERIRNSQRNALSNAGLSEEDIRSKVIKCEEVPSKDGGMTIHCN